jgi:hypothetical protein
MGQQHDAQEADEVLAALEALCQGLQENTARNELALKRAKEIRQLRAQGRSYSEIVTGKNGPLIVEMTRENLNQLLEKGSRLRRAEAAALYEEGMTMEQIAEVFGVTRQRISALLRNHRRANA